MLELLREKSPQRGIKLLIHLSRKRSPGGHRKWKFKKGDIFWCGESLRPNPWVVSSTGKFVLRKHELFVWIRDVREMTDREKLALMPRFCKVVQIVSIYRLKEQPMASIIRSVWVTPETVKRYLRIKGGRPFQKIANHPNSEHGDQGIQSLYRRLSIMPGRVTGLYEIPE